MTQESGQAPAGGAAQEQPGHTARSVGPASGKGEQNGTRPCQRGQNTLMGASARARQGVLTGHGLVLYCGAVRQAYLNTPTQSVHKACVSARKCTQDNKYNPEIAPTVPREHEQSTPHTWRHQKVPINHDTQNARQMTAPPTRRPHGQGHTTGQGKPEDKWLHPPTCCRQAGNTPKAKQRQAPKFGPCCTTNGLAPTELKLPKILAAEHASSMQQCRTC